MKIDRFKGPRPLSGIVGPLARRALAGRPTAFRTLLADWSAIIGDDPDFLASTPRKLVLPRGSQTGGTLTLAVSPGQALQVQHETARLAQRINLHYGQSLVGRVRVTVEEPRHSPSPRRRKLSAREEADLVDRLECIDDPALKATLERLGRAVIAGG